MVKRLKFRPLAVMMLSIIMAAAFAATGNDAVAFASTQGDSVAPSGNGLAKENSANPGDDQDSSDYKAHEAVVLYDTDDSVNKKEAASLLKEDVSVKVEDVYNIEHENGDNQAIAVVRNNSLTVKSLVKKLNDSDNVKIAEPNYISKVSSGGAAYFGQQWHLENTGQNDGVAGEDVKIYSKPQVSASNKVVAVIDTGIDYTNPDLKDAMWENDGAGNLAGDYGVDLINGDDDPMDDYGHGSHCAGIIAAQGQGTEGVEPTVKLMALKAFDDEGYGDLSSEVGAYEYISRALDAGVDVCAINDSWGGEDESKILEEVITRVGQKGALTVCAAGNESEDFDDDDSVKSYPAAYDNPYIITVAATDEKGKLADFSNRGEDYVDIAAPGVDILSTICYANYAPYLYGGPDAVKQKQCSQKFNDFDSDEISELNSDWTPAVTDADTVECSSLTSELSGAYNLGQKGGQSLKVTAEGLKSGSVATFRTSYVVPEDEDENWQSISAMIKCFYPKNGEYSYIVAVDVPKGTVLTDSNIDDYEYAGYYFAAGDSWNEITLDTNMDDASEPGQTRDLVFFIYSEAAGDYTVYMDALGLSNVKATDDDFGKYAYMSGTSMATPVVTGAAAAYTAALDSQYESKDDRAVAVKNAVLSSVKQKDELKGEVATGGILDFSQEVHQIFPASVSDITVDVNNDQITLKGAGFAADDLKVELQNVDVKNDEYKTAEIISSSDKKIVIKNNGWINHYANVRVTTNGKIKTRKEVSLTNGKDDYNATYGESIEADAITTDGNYIYQAVSEDSTIYIVDPSEFDPYEEDETSEEEIEENNEDEGDDEIAISRKDIFGERETSNSSFELIFGSDLLSSDGNIYNVVQLAEVSPEGSSSVISSEYRLIGVSKDSGELVVNEELPTALLTKKDYAVCAYESKLYFLGGYDRRAKAVSTAVEVYDMEKGTWSEGKELPVARAAGKALQTENVMVYAMGYSNEEDCPGILVFDGENWKTSKAELGIYSSDTVSRGGREYDLYSGIMSVCKDGIEFIDTPAIGNGDTFIYNVEADSFRDTGYTAPVGETSDDDEDDDEWIFFFEDEEEEYTASENGIILGDTLYFFADDDVTYTIPADDPTVKVYSKSIGKKGSVKGVCSYMPGDLAILKGVGKGGYYCKKISSGSLKGTKGTLKIRMYEDHPVSASFAKYKMTLKSSASVKAGKTYTLQPKFSPSAAKVQKTLTYKVSNKKYAEVSKDGVVTTYKAGKNKTVKITVKADSKISRTIKLKIK